MARFGALTKDGVPHVPGRQDLPTEPGPGRPALPPVVDGRAPAGAPLLPRWLNRRYRIVSRLGSGGMNTILQGVDAALGERPVAIKYSESAAFQRYLVREALLLAGLSHPCLPSVYDLFQENGRTYLVMELIEGNSLYERLCFSPAQCLPLKDVLRFGVQLCTVLDYLHAHHPPIIFQDLKPANIMVTGGGHLYLIDFGLSRPFLPGQPVERGCTPGYAAPEYYGTHPITPQADVYALGVTLHQLLTGENPTRGLSAPGVGYSPIAVRDTLFSPVKTLLMQMLTADPARRPNGMGAVRGSLEYILALL